MPLHTGDRVPDFTAQQDSGRPYAPAPGRWRVLFFFPKTATTHCQLQARRYQALAAEFQAHGVDIVGVNGDPKQEQARFRELCKLDYPLLDDRKQEITTLFGVLDDPWPDEEVRRPRRETFLVAPDGIITDHWTEVNPGQDAETVLARVRERMEAELQV
ncbi:peroxiredoxin [Deinococcus arcticus]|uniref:thioredoxin-dependent peroxiredoxin n=1 Tax=Deinococcus arcticus TaxID=2136176 RepID=A0A2T3WD98_9DEIO|nr:peroxiredoxin [Deinococcus arcticus]PTA69866.1 peroxiredoxin [Deinococcus arcticus]